MSSLAARAFIFVVVAALAVEPQQAVFGFRTCHAFLPVMSLQRARMTVGMSSSTSTTAETPTESTAAKTNKNDLLKRDRYVATNRFAVRKGKQAKFEQRWATRKSQLATLDGFRYFHLMRRVQLEEDGSTLYDGGDESDDAAFGNYVSFTIWETKKDFNKWRTGEAFKEAHGGTSLGAFVSTLVSSTLVLRGPPRPAFYDGILLQSPDQPEFQPTLVDGWRSVEADGRTTLPPECFVACNQFFVPPENAASFEARWANRESTLQQFDGFVAFCMLRRDGSAKGHGVSPVTSTEPSYVSTTIWRDRKAFEKWRESNNFKQAHSGGGGDKKEGATTPPPPPSKPQWSRPPKPVFYEGTLVITSSEGA